MEKRVIAVLGPTNTGKTHLAIERLCGHDSGMIGFPLRLLARENYDRVVRIKGASRVALVTGEEKIIPPNARYFICTVESMPVDKPVSFLAVDEIQLAADAERGHLFTDRLLRARGTSETMFLGSDTMKPLIRRLVPQAEFISRPRFSMLQYSGYRKLTRLPPRTAVVAFSATEVYETAELIRRQRGGTAVVLGALSPRTRNAQVEMYQNGDVDYLVATDAIGMGLNMDINHVAFGRLHKFDGVSTRHLSRTELAQIAGRAGRHMSDGTFGTTGDLGDIDEEDVEAIESHEFETLTEIRWRNADLDMRDPRHLLRSLEAGPPRRELRRAREADDLVALRTLAADSEVVALADNRERTRLLWDICQIPDFRKTLTDSHVRLLKRIYKSLARAPRHLPEDWIARQVTQIDRTDGDIDMLMGRIAHIRTWTYIAHRTDWVRDPGHWQERTRAIEDRLSDALHEQLTQRFVDRRSAVLSRGLLDGDTLAAAVRRNGDVVVEGHYVGQLQGFRFEPDTSAHSQDARAMLSAARRTLGPEIARRVGALETADDAEFVLTERGEITWNEAPVAYLARGGAVLAPLVTISADDLLDGQQAERVRSRLGQWVQQDLRRRLPALFTLADRFDTGPARGIAYQLQEALGAVERRSVRELIDALGKSGRQKLARSGVRLGPRHVYVPELLKPEQMALRALLWAIHHGRPLPARVPSGSAASAAIGAGGDAALHRASGYEPLGPRAVRIDMLDRLTGEIHALADKRTFPADPKLAQMLGCSRDDLEAVLAHLGHKREVAEDGSVHFQLRVSHLVERKARGRKGVAARGKGATTRSESPFSVLKDHVAAR